MSYLGPKICSLVPADIKNPETLNTFELKIKRWVSQARPLENMQNISWTNSVYNKIKKLIFSEVKLKYYHNYHYEQAFCYF